MTKEVQRFTSYNYINLLLSRELLRIFSYVLSEDTYVSDGRFKNFMPGTLAARSVPYEGCLGRTKHN